jgi:hypothetical protein
MSISAEEIDYEAIDGKLSSKFPAAEPAIAQTKPE